MLSHSHRWLDFFYISLFKVGNFFHNKSSAQSRLSLNYPYEVITWNDFSAVGWRSFPTCWTRVGCFFFTLQSNLSQTVSTWFHLVNSGAQFIWCSIYHSLSWSNIPHTVWCVCVAWCNKSCWLNVPRFLNKSPTLSPVKHALTSTPLPCFRMGTMCAVFRSTFLCLTKTLTLEPKASNLDPSDHYKYRFPLIYYSFLLFLNPNDSPLLTGLSFFEPILCCGGNTEPTWV